MHYFIYFISSNFKCLTNIIYNYDIMKLEINFRFSVILLIVLFLVILWSSTVCDCTHGGAYGLYEGLKTMSSSVKSKVKENMNNNKDIKEPKESNVAKNKLSTKKTKEGFGTALSEAHSVDTSRWTNPALGAAPTSVGKSEANPQLASGELDFFANTDFKPECCPTTYSNSMGCACISDNQYKYLITRGGNNVPFSQY